MDLHKLLALFTAVLCWDICLSQQHPVARRQAQDISDSRDAVGSSAEFLMHGEFVAALGSDAAFADCYLTTDEIASDPQAAAFAATFIAATAVQMGVDPADLVLDGISTVGNEGPGCGEAVFSSSLGLTVDGDFIGTLGDDGAFADCYLTADEIASDPEAAAFADAFIALTAAQQSGVDPADIVLDGISTSGNDGPGCDGGGDGPETGR